jgi:hypothetical protein
MPELLVSVPGARHGQLPLAEDSAWLSAKLFTARDSMDEIIGRHLPALTASLGTDEVWFIRYRNREETDHLRVRIAAGHGQAAHRAAALVAWVSDLRVRRLCARFALDIRWRVPQPVRQQLRRPIPTRSRNSSSSGVNSTPLACQEVPS